VPPIPPERQIPVKGKGKKRMTKSSNYAVSGFCHYTLRPVVKILLPLAVFCIAAGCRTADPAAQFLAKMDRAPEESRPKNWEQTRSLMARRAPKVGEVAPNFSLPTRDGTGTVTLASHQAGRPAGSHFRQLHVTAFPSSVWRPGKVPSKVP
jgi:hypothetical protein